MTPLPETSPPSHAAPPALPSLVLQSAVEALTPEQSAQMSRGVARTVGWLVEAIAVLLALRVTGLAAGLGPAGTLLALLAGAAVGPVRDRPRLVVAHRPLDELPDVARLAGLATVAVAAISALAAPTDVRSGQLAGFWLVLVVGVSCARLAIARAPAALRPPQRTLLIGEIGERETFRRHLAVAPHSHVQLVSEVDVDGIGRGDGRHATLEELIATHRIHRVIVLPGADRDRVAQAARRARNAGLAVTVSTTTLQSVGVGVEVEQVGGSVLMTAAPAGPGVLGAVVKRWIDVTLAGAALLAASPLMALIALAVKLDGPGGSIFYRQERIGRGGRRFHITKFRTMVPGAHEMRATLAAANQSAGIFKLTDDPRVTRVGLLLRRSCLDELPQLLDVLRGDMALVGPRPLIPEEDALVRTWHRDRLLMRPGITGPWQVGGSARIPLTDMVAMDHQYVANWSLWNDARILLRTVGFVAGRQGL